MMATAKHTDMKFVTYDKYLYLFPPRPEQTTKHTQLHRYDNGEYVAQPKYNGDCCDIFMNETTLIVMNRHNGVITTDYRNIDFRAMYNGIGGKGWVVLCGEFLNKNKKGEDGNPFNIKFVIWDILVYNNKYFIGSITDERLLFLEHLFPCTKMSVGDDGMLSYKHICCTKYKNIYKSPCYYDNFEALYNDIVNTDLYEGLVIKRRKGVLSYGLSEKNNNTWQIKCRKPTKNYTM